MSHKLHKSCLANLMEFLEFVSKYVDKDIPGDVIYIILNLNKYLQWLMLIVVFHRGQY